MKSLITKTNRTLCIIALVLAATATADAKTLELGRARFHDAKISAEPGTVCIRHRDGMGRYPLAAFSVEQIQALTAFEPALSANPHIREALRPGGLATLREQHAQIVAARQQAAERQQQEAAQREAHRQAQIREAQRVAARQADEHRERQRQQAQAKSDTEAAVGLGILLAGAYVLNEILGEGSAPAPARQTGISEADYQRELQRRLQREAAERAREEATGL